MKITAIRRQRGTRNQVLVEAGELRLKLSTATVTSSGLRIGQLLDDATLARLTELETAIRCKESALRLLAHRPRTEKELKDRLLSRKLPAEVVASCIADLRRAGLLDDEAFGRSLSTERLRSRPAGRRRMVADLRTRGMDAKMAEEVVGRAMEEAGASEDELARRAAARFRRRAGEDPVRARRRLFGFLGRRGFPTEVAAEVVAELIPED